MSDRPWQDWTRVEDCLTFGVRRWFWFVIAVFAIDKYIRPQSESLSAVCDLIAFIAFRKYVERDDAKRAATTALRTET